MSSYVLLSAMCHGWCLACAQHVLQKLKKSAGRLSEPSYQYFVINSCITNMELICPPNTHQLVNTLTSRIVSSFHQIIAKKVREVLGIEEPYWNRSISLLHREPLGLFLERKSNTGVEADLLTFEDYKRQLKRQEQSKQNKR